jgi:hypothetical protein
MLKKYLKKYKIFRSLNTEYERKERKLLIEAAILKTVIVCNIFITLVIILDFETSFFWTLFSAFLLFEWDSRIVGSFAILALTACPILLSLEYQADAEQMAVYAYYFLVMTVVLQIIEFKRSSSSEQKPAANRIIDLRRVNKNI